MAQVYKFSAGSALVRIASEIAHVGGVHIARLDPGPPSYDDSEDCQEDTLAYSDGYFLATQVSRSTESASVEWVARPWDVCTPVGVLCRSLDRVENREILPWYQYGFDTRRGFSLHIFRILDINTPIGYRALHAAVGAAYEILDMIASCNLHLEHRYVFDAELKDSYPFDESLLTMQENDIQAQISQELAQYIKETSRSTLSYAKGAYAENTTY